MPVTFNPNNNYDVEIVTVADANDPYNNGIQNLVATGEDYVEIKITPTTFGYPLLAGNMRINDGASFNSSGTTGMAHVPWSARSNPNTWQVARNEQCLPPITPHNLPISSPNAQHVKASNYWLLGQACQNPSFYGGTPYTNSLTNANYGFDTGSYIAPNFVLNPSFQGPYIWYPTHGSPTGYPPYVYAGGGVGHFWTQIIMFEVYEDDNGNLINDNLTPDNGYNSNAMLGPTYTHNWSWWDPTNPSTPITNNIYPKYLKCFIFIVNAPSNWFPGNETILIDVDEAAPLSGCMDPTALNYNPLAVIDNGTCQYLGVTYSTVTLSFSIASVGGNSGPVPAGPYTDGSQYGITVPFPPPGQTFSYGTVDYLAAHSPSTSNIRLDNGNLTQSITITDTQGNAIYYAPGDHVNEIVEVYVYPYTDQSGGGPIIYDFPVVGGPNGFGPPPNLPDPTSTDYDDYVQRIYPGWGNTKNNLTAASLTTLVGSGGPGNFWLDAEYEDPLVTSPIQYSLWHNGPDSTGLQPTQRVDYNYGGSVPATISGISGIEEYNPNPSSPARDWFPTRVKVSVQLDFYLPSQNATPGPGSGGFNVNGNDFEVTVLIKHDTSKQGDLNWTI
tara:strand:+ start:3403 stop:5238 length:1836 start_codon:yes stop_codon:yes gene_type:complete